MVVLIFVVVIRYTPILNKDNMQELIKLIALNTALPTDKSTEALYIVSQFIKEKYPLLSPTVDTVLGPTPEIRIKETGCTFLNAHTCCCMQ